MYALQARAFDDTAVETAALFAEQASVVLANAQAFTQAQATAVSLGEALTSRSVIDMAKGIVTAREGCSADDAFHRVREHSQTRHVQLREVAQDPRRRCRARPWPRLGRASADES